MKKMPNGIHCQILVFQESCEGAVNFIADFLMQIKCSGLFNYYSRSLRFGFQYGIGLLLRLDKKNKIPTFQFWKILEIFISTNLPDGWMYRHMEYVEKRTLDKEFPFYFPFRLENGLFIECLKAVNDEGAASFYKALNEKT